MPDFQHWYVENQQTFMIRSPNIKYKAPRKKTTDNYFYPGNELLLYVLSQHNQWLSC